MYIFWKYVFGSYYKRDHCCRKKSLSDTTGLFTRCSIWNCPTTCYKNKNENIKSFYWRMHGGGDEKSGYIRHWYMFTDYDFRVQTNDTGPIQSVSTVHCKFGSRIQPAEDYRSKYWQGFDISLVHFNHMSLASIVDIETEHLLYSNIPHRIVKKNKKNKNF
jgi:hypothetical protein